MDTEINAAGEPEPNRYRMYSLVGPAVRDSFLGSDRILELFDGDQLNAARAAMTASVRKAELQGMRHEPASGAAPSVDVMFSEDTLNHIVDTVLRRMSAEAIREVAWEVVPELSESIIRRTMEEQNKA